MEALWIGAAFTLGLLGRQFGLPPLAGYLLAGFVLHAFHFESGPLLDAVAHYGVLLLLFSVGLKLDLRSLLNQSILGTAVLHLAVTTILIGLLLLTTSDLGLTGAVFLAVIFGFSSTVLAAKVLEDRREVRAFHGRVAIGVHYPGYCRGRGFEFCRRRYAECMGAAFAGIATTSSVALSVVRFQRAR